MANVIEVLEDISLKRGVAQPTIADEGYLFLWRTREDVEGGLETLREALAESVLEACR